MHRNARAVVQGWNQCRLGACYSQSPDLEGYKTLKRSSSFELIIQKSQFLAKAWKVQDSAQAIGFIKEHSDPKASHNCFAYKIEFESKYSDDGEPSGTGGKPIFAAIESAEFDRVCVLVTRHFGGIKLGVGPLARAYGEAARTCLTSAETEIVRPMVEAQMRLNYQAIFKLHSILLRLNGKIMNKIPTPSGLCVVTFRIEEQYYDDFKDYVAQVTAGKVIPRITNKTGIL